MGLYQLGAQDALFLYSQTQTNLTHTTSISVYDPSTAPGGEVRFKDILGHVRSRLNISSVFRRKLHSLPLDLDHPYWVEDEHFDLEAHISHTRLPLPGDWRQLCIFIARHHSRPMDMTRPLWDMMVVEGLDCIDDFPKGSYGIATRIHHATIDGASGTRFFTALSDLDADGKPAIATPKKKPDHGRIPTNAEVMSRALTSNLSSPVKLARNLARFAPALIEGAQKRGKEDDKTEKSGIPDTRFNGVVSPHKVFGATTFQLDTFKQIKNQVEGATINDVVLTICGGALRKYLTKHRELPKESLVGWVPINARTATGEDEEAGNRITAMTLPIGSDIADPVDRLTSVRAHSSDAKAAKSGLGARIMTDLSQHIPGATMSGVIRLLNSERFLQKSSNVFISNVPGPNVPLYMNGAKCIYTNGLAPISNGMGLFIATPSYNGRMTFGITSDRKIMPDVEFFCECLREAHDELQKAVNSPKHRAAKSAQVIKQKEKASAKKQAPTTKRINEINP